MKRLQVITVLSIFSCLTLPSMGADNLENYFNKTQINSIQEYKNDYEKIKSAKDLANSYNKANKIMTIITDSINSHKSNQSQDIDLEKYKWLNNYIPSLKLSYGAEGIGLNLMYDNNVLLKKAKMTPEKSDDIFINLMIEIYGDSGDQYPNWFVMTWDYGGYTLLGKGNHYKVLEKIKSTMKSSPEFIEALKRMKESIFMDIRDSNNFGFTKDKVIKEINTIKKMPNLSILEKNILHKKLNDMNKNPKEFQFNCEKANCSYG